MLPRFRRFVTLGLLLLAACQSSGPGFQPLPIALRVDADVSARWGQMPALDPRVGPEENLGSFVNHAQALQVVRRRVPAGVPAPCLALRDDAQIALDHDRWLFGLRSVEGVEVLPCIYDLVLADTSETISAFARYPDTQGHTWLRLHWVLAFSQNSKFQVLVSEAPGRWYEHMPFGVTIEPGVPRAKQRLAFRNVPGDQAIVLGERRWPWNVSSEGRAIDGTSGSELYASFLRHDDGVLFAARGPNGRDWAVWKLDPDTGNATALGDSRYIFAWTPPASRDWRGRLEHDERTSYDDVLPYVARPSPHDASLLWLRRQTGQYEPPPGTQGVIPLLTLPARYESVSKIANWPGRNEQDLVPVRYVRRVEQFLVAYDTASGRMWGTASPDFESLSGPLYSQVMLRRSPALSTRVNYDAKVLGASEWVLVQRASDGAWAIGYGCVPDATAFRAGVEPDQLVAEAELAVEKEQVPLVKNAELAKVLDQQMQELRRLAAEAERAKQREEALRIYTWAMQNGSNVYGWSSATQLGGQELVDFALRLGTLGQCEQVLANNVWNDAQTAALTQHVAALKAQRAAEAERARAIEQQHSGSGGGGGGIDWNGWRRETMNAQSANQLGLTGEAFQSYMMRYR
jgi:hypothetical protein